MKLFTVFFLLISYVPGMAQKNDDMTDTRKKNEGFLKVQQKEIKADLSSFTMAGIDESVAKGSITKIPFTSIGPDFTTFEGNNMKATVSIATFDPSKHKMDYDEKYLIKIDKKPYYGNYGKLPLTMIKSITLTINGDSVIIPPSAYFDLYNLNFTFKDKQGVDRSSNGIYHSRDGHRLYLYLLCRDNSGSYEVTFVIQDKKYAFRVLDYGFM